MIDLMSLLIVAGSVFVGAVAFGWPVGYLMGFAAATRADNEPVLEAEFLEEDQSCR